MLYPFAFENATTWVVFVGEEFLVESRLDFVCDSAQVGHSEQFDAQAVVGVAQQLSVEVDRVRRTAHTKKQTSM